MAKPNQKPLSTVERWMQKPGFKDGVEREYELLKLYELVHAMMDSQDKSVRKLAEEVGVSKTVIQNLRSGQQKDIKLSNFLRVTQACGFQLVLQKNRQRVSLREGVKRSHGGGVKVAYRVLRLRNSPVPKRV